MAFNPNDNSSKVDQRNKPLIGVVVNNQDPLQLRRVQLKIEGLLETDDEKSLPWFRPETSGAASRTDYGTFDEIPEVNSTVSIKIQDGDLRSGTYSAMPDTTVDASQIRLFGEDYPATGGECDSKGTWDRKNKAQGYEEHLHQSGFYTQVDNKGNLHVYVPSSVYIHIKGSVAIKVDENVFMKVLKMFGIRAEKNSGISCGENIEVVAKDRILLESETGSLVDFNLGELLFDIQKATNEAVEDKESIPKRVDERWKDVRELQQAVLKSGEVSDEAIKAHKKSLLGTRT